MQLSHFCDKSLFNPPLNTHTPRRSRRFGWCLHTRGCLAEGRSSQGIWSCRQVRDRLSPETVSHGLHSLPETGSCSLEGSHRIQTDAAGHNTVHGCLLQNKQFNMHHFSIPFLTETFQKYLRTVSVVLYTNTYPIKFIYIADIFVICLCTKLVQWCIIIVLYCFVYRVSCRAVVSKHIFIYLKVRNLSL